MQANLKNEIVKQYKNSIKVSHSVNTVPLNLNKVLFTQVEPYYSEKRPNPQFGIVGRYSLNGLVDLLNIPRVTGKKDSAPAILKGIYEGGTSGNHCIVGSPYLFYDIDVKPNENSHLLDAKLNADVFEQLKDISLLVWRSNSKKGIAGILYIPKLVKYLNINRSEHLEVGNAITNYLQKKLGVNATFDQAQSKYRQIRYLANQSEKRVLNPFPYRFDVEVNKVEVVSKTGTPQFRFASGRAAYGSIQHQFNEKTNIRIALQECGFSQINETRYLHPATTSKTTGEIIKDKNIFISNSTSFDSTYAVFSPYWLYMKCGNYGSIREFNDYLKQQGYKETKPTQNVIKKATNELKESSRSRTEQIFKACYDLQNLPYNEKRAFAKKGANGSKELAIFHDYLKIKPLSITYDKTITIDKYVSEQLPAILNYSDKHKKLIVKAGTGLGKTTSVLKGFKNLRGGKRLLFLAPLTVIVDQIAAQYDDVVTLTGRSEAQAHTLAKTSTTVVATYEQGFKHIRDGNKFDYVVIDEAHNLISGYSYKAKTLKELTYYLRGQKVIGLSGTPSLLFKAIGYKLLNVEKKSQKSVEVTMRIDNRDSSKIILQHLENIKGKALIRLNNVDNLKEIKNELIRLRNYSDEEILILQSSIGCKQSDNFKLLTNKGKFANCVKIVLTTGIIDEGLSIEQLGFTDMVFIENQYNPRPEPVKQFFARFRNDDANRKNYYYFKQKKIEYQRSYNPYYDYNTRISDLKAFIQDYDNNIIDTRDTASNAALFYKHGIIDRYALANEVSQSYFDQLTIEEYVLFQQINYDLSITIERDYKKQTIDLGLITDNLKKKKLTIIEGWQTQFEQVEFALYRLTEDKDLKDTIEYNGEPIEYNIMDLVDANLKSFEFLYRAYLQLQVLEVQDVDEVLFPDSKFSKQKINRRIRLLQNLQVINNPLSKNDIKNSNKLIAFVDEVVKLDQFKVGDLIKMWKKMRVTSMNISSYDLIDLVLYFKAYRFLRRSNIYKAILVE